MPGTNRYRVAREINIINPIKKRRPTFGTRVCKRAGDSGVGGDGECERLGSSRARPHFGQKRAFSECGLLQCGQIAGDRGDEGNGVSTISLHGSFGGSSGSSSGVDFLGGVKTAFWGFWFSSKRYTKYVPQFGQFSSLAVTWCSQAGQTLAPSNAIIHSFFAMAHPVRNEIQAC